MRPLDFWTDFFVIATATSNTHLMGMERHIKDFVIEKGLEILHRSRKPEKNDDWCLLDLGGIVIHLMSADVRSFFELERLWSAAPLIYEGKEEGSGEGEASENLWRFPGYSSKSS
jgi:ribosome-associated protein